MKRKRRYQKKMYSAHTTTKARDFAAKKTKLVLYFICQFIMFV